MYSVLEYTTYLNEHVEYIAKVVIYCEIKHFATTCSSPTTYYYSTLCCRQANIH